MSKRSLALATASATALALLTACGSSSTPKASSPSTNSRPSTVSCSYPSAGTAARPVNAPSSTPITSVTQLTLATNHGVVEITLDPKDTPCTVNSFVSLARQHYFDNTPCPRVVTSGIYVLQCGDPTGTGSGGPGYQFNDELAASAEPKGCSSNGCIYPAGTVAMANAGADTNGSQFFLVYKDSPLAYNYTIFGHMSAAGIKVVAAIAAHGDDNSNPAGGGVPNEKVTIVKATVQ